MYDLQGVFNYDESVPYFHSRFFQQDKDGNIYFRSYSGSPGIKRLVFGQAGEIEVEHYVDDNSDHRVDWFYADAQGNVLFDGGQKMKKATGGIVATEFPVLAFRGFNQESYALSLEEPVFPGSRESLKYYALNLEEGSVGLAVEGVSGIGFAGELGNLHYCTVDSKHAHVFLTDAAVTLGEELPEYLPYGFIWEEGADRWWHIRMPENVPDLVHFIGFEKNHIWLQDVHNSGYYVAVDLDDYRVNEVDQTAEFVVAEAFELPPHLDILWAEYWNDQVIHFKGYDLQKEVWVTGKLSISNGIEYWDESSTLGSTQLVRIN
jgi:hypothetical protein